MNPSFWIFFGIVLPALLLSLWCIFDSRKYRHPKTCDVDPKTLTWKRSIDANGPARVCADCWYHIINRDGPKVWEASSIRKVFEP